MRRLLSEGFKETCEGFRQKREFASYFFAKKKKKTYDVLRRYIKKKESHAILLLNQDREHDNDENLGDLRDWFLRE